MRCKLIQNVLKILLIIFIPIVHNCEFFYYLLGDDDDDDD
jgi:hypothetical protein